MFDSIDTDSIALTFNGNVISFLNRTKFENSFDLDKLHEHKVNESQNERITDYWNLQEISNLEVVPIKEILKTNIDSIYKTDWKTFDGIDVKHFCIISKPYYSKNKKIALVTLQIYNDSIYYFDSYQLIKKDDWQILSKSSYKFDLIKVYMEKYDKDVIEFGPLQYVFLGDK